MDTNANPLTVKGRVDYFEGINFLDCDSSIYDKNEIYQTQISPINDKKNNIGKIQNNPNLLVHEENTQILSRGKSKLEIQLNKEVYQSYNLSTIANKNNPTQNNVENSITKITPNFISVEKTQDAIKRNDLFRVIFENQFKTK
jgi:hypothetical protein